MLVSEKNCHGGKMMKVCSKTLLSFMVLAAFCYKTDLPLFAQTSVQKLTPVLQPTMNLPDTRIGDHCSFMLNLQKEPVFFCLTAVDLPSANPQTPQYEFKTYLYSRAINAAVSWRAKPVQATWIQEDIYDQSIHQLMADGKILIWQGAGNGGLGGPVLLDNQGYQITVPGIFRLGKDQVYQPVDLTKIQDPEFISTPDGRYILVFSETKNGQKLWKVWGLAEVSDKFGNGQLITVWEKTLPLTGNIDRVTFFQTSNQQTIVAYSETVKNKVKIQVINFGRLAQAAALRPIAVWKNTFEIPGFDAEKFLEKQSLINIQEYKTGQFLLSVGGLGSEKSNTYTKQCFWVFREGVNLKDGFSSPVVCKNYYSHSVIDQQGNLWLAHLEKAPSSESPDLVVEILYPFVSPFWGDRAFKNLKIKLPAGVFLSEWSLSGQSIPWMDTIATQPDQMPKLMLVVGGVYEEKMVDVFLEIGANGNMEKPFILPRPTGDSFVRAKDVNTFQPTFFEGKISADQKHVWISGRYWWPFSTLLPGGNSRSQLFYVPLSP